MATANVRSCRCGGLAHRQRRTIAWLTGYIRLILRYKRKPSYFVTFVILVATMICHKRLTIRGKVHFRGPRFIIAYFQNAGPRNFCHRVMLLA